MQYASMTLAAAWPLLSLAQIPEPVLPAGVGVNIHFVTGHERDLDLIGAAGFKFIRMDFGWEATEKARGEYDWSGYDQLSGNLAKRGLRPVYILDYSHRLYEDAVEAKNPITGQPDQAIASPRKPESVAAFARWAAAAAAHFKGRGVIWEIWNEPNLTFWRPKPNAEDYTALALATGKAIRAADPRATLIGPAVSGFAPAFMEKFLASGVLEHLDGVSVHPYRDYSKPPESAAMGYDTLRKLIDRYTPGARQGSIPVLSGEWGYATHTKGLDLETQAAFAARQQLANLLCQVPLSIWYDWKNDGDDPNEREHNFGTVFRDLRPKPAYRAIQTLTRELAGCRVVRRHDTGNERDYVLLLNNPAGETKLAAWTMDQPHRVELTLSPDTSVVCRVACGDGSAREAQVERGRLSLELALAPQYVTLGRLSPVQ